MSQGRTWTSRQPAKAGKFQPGDRVVLMEDLPTALLAKGAHGVILGVCIEHPKGYKVRFRAGGWTLCYESWLARRLSSGSWDQESI